MAGARAVLRDRAEKSGKLTDLMGHLNRLLAADHEGTRFMTMHLSVIDSQSGTMRWVSAGHDPAILYDPAVDRFVELSGANIPLGIVAETVYEERAARSLRSGHVITIGTDGVWEMPNDKGEQFGKQRLREAIKSAASGTAKEIVQAILERLTAFRGDCRPVDDVTFVVIKVGTVGVVETARPSPSRGAW
jgi:sigma-B regulation protein RsbU (phosphoserine phosphatase)